MRIIKENTMAILIDIQERLLPAMSDNKKILSKAQILVNGLNELNIPIIVSEQYPKGLGRTVEELQSILGNVNYYAKTAFSCYNDKSILNEIKKQNKKNIILFGIEAHVCVLQTATDLLQNGYNVILVEDAIGSRNNENKNTAIKRFISEGGILTCVESILFEFVGDAKAREFKAISKLIK